MSTHRAYKSSLLKLSLDCSSSASKHSGTKAMDSKRTKLEDRYELKELLARGGMGLVYRASDLLMKRDVALKTLLDIDNPETLELFYKECDVLATMVHPNIISIYDAGEFKEGGSTKPFFTMPLLPGATLERLIRDGRKRCNVRAVVDIISQACRGLHAAHELGLVHRDIKPSNIFVLDDDSIKIIDFGIARSATAASRTTLKGTLFYMSPEQVRMKAPSALTDQYALGIVCYEALTGQRPFRGTTDREVAEAILFKASTSVAELNPDVSLKLSQVVHRAFARDSLHRFADVREFGSALQSAFRNEPLPYFEIGKVRGRLDRASASFAAGNVEFASELLGEIESEGFLDEQITTLRQKIDQRMRRQKAEHALSDARSSLEAGELTLALRKVEQALDIDPTDADAVALRLRVSKLRQEQKVGASLQLASQHMATHSFQEARQALGEVLTTKPVETEALSLLTQLGRREQDVARISEKKLEIFQVAQKRFEQGNLVGALSKLDTLLELERQNPDPDLRKADSYRKLRDTVNATRVNLQKAYEQAEENVLSGDYEKALAVCNQVLEKHSGEHRLLALKIDIEQRQRQRMAERIGSFHSELDSETDLDRRIVLIEQAAARYANEPYFKTLLKPAQERRNLVRSIVERARGHEERQEWEDALEQWNTLGSVHPAYPGLSEVKAGLEAKHSESRRGSERDDAIADVRRALDLSDYESADQKSRQLISAFPEDEKVGRFCREVESRIRNGKEAQRLLAEAAKTVEQGGTSAALPQLREALQLEPVNQFIKTVLVNSLVQSAREQAPNQTAEAQELVAEALKLDSSHKGAQKLSTELTERGQRDFAAWCCAQAQELASQGDLEGALVLANKGIESHAGDEQLQELRAELLRRQTQGSSVSQVAISPPVEIPVRKTEPLPQPEVTTRPPVVPVKAESTQPNKRGPKKLGLFAAATAALLLLGSTGYIYRDRILRSPVQTSLVSVSPQMLIQVNVQPPAASLAVDDKSCGFGSCRVSVTPGSHRITASLDGYTTAERIVSLKTGSEAGPIQMELRAASPAISFASDVPGAAFVLDGKPVNLEQGSSGAQPIQQGSHALKFNADSLSNSLQFVVKPGAMPSIQPLIQRRDLISTVAVAFGPSARLYSTLANAELQVDGNANGKLIDGSTTITGLEAGGHELLVTAEGVSQRLLVNSGPTPFLSFFTGTPNEPGYLKIKSNQDEVKIFIDGFLMKQTVRGGTFIARLPAKTYTIRAEKNGFVPLEFSDVAVRKKDQTELTFNFIPENLVSVTEKAPIRPEVTPESLGTVKLLITPQDVQPDLTVQLGKRPPQIVKTRQFSLPAGVYLLNGRAQGYDPATAYLTVTAGKEAKMLLEFHKSGAPVAAGPVGYGLEAWSKLPGWRSAGEGLAREGGGYVRSPYPSGAGEYRFTAILPKGKRLQWTVNYLDGDNFVFFELSKGRFEYHSVVDGKTKDKGKGKVVKLEEDQVVTITTRVTTHDVAVSVSQGGQTENVGHVSDQELDFTKGRFTFFVEPKTTLDLRQFRFTP